MPVTWPDIAFQTDEDLSLQIEQAWGWLLKGREFRPFIASKFGDVFFETRGGKVECLSCSLGEIEQVAQSRVEFEQVCDEVGESVLEWFGPGLVDELHKSGRVAGAGSCYAFGILPIFAECEYTVANLRPVPTHEVVVGLADLHKQIADVPDGASVQFEISE